LPVSLIAVLTESAVLQVYLPHGAYVKVSASGQLLNVWIVPSPTDLHMTEGSSQPHTPQTMAFLKWLTWFM